ncbi:MAG: hypothetical protein ACUVQP_00185 [Bacteroidales bacterium]
MPILITPDIIAATEQPQVGWNYLEVVAVSERANKNNDGMDTMISFEILHGPGDSDANKGKRAFYWIYSNAIKKGVADECRLLIEFLTAVSGLPVSELAGKEFDFTEFIGRKLYGEIVDRAYEGKIMKRFATFATADAIPF